MQLPSIDVELMQNYGKVKWVVWRETRTKRRRAARNWSVLHNRGEMVARLVRLSRD